MTMNLGSFYTAGRGLVSVLALTAGLHCRLPQERIPYTPKPVTEYQAHPGWEREIAFHEIKKILGDSCSIETVTETSFTCWSTHCDYYYDRFVPATSSHIEHSIRECGASHESRAAFDWSEIHSVHSNGYCLRFNKTSGDCDLYTSTVEQAPALKKAIEIYTIMKDANN